MLRVSGGEARGRKLKGPKGLEFRPTTGRVKEFIFSVIGPAIESVSVLDLFSGSGSLAIEAISRGAGSVVCVEQSSQHVRIIEQNLQMCGYKDKVRILRGDVFRMIRMLGKQNQCFQLILADPPFKAAFREQIVRTVHECGILDPGGWLIIEHQSDDSDHYQSTLELKRSRQFGHCMVSIYE